MPLYRLSVNRNMGFRTEPDMLELFIRSDSAIRRNSSRWPKILETLVTLGNPKAVEMQKTINRMTAEPMQVLTVEDITEEVVVCPNVMPRKSRA